MIGAVSRTVNASESWERRGPTSARAKKGTRMPLEREILLTVEEVAKILRVSIGWVYDHANGKRPALPAVRLGSALRFRESAIAAFIESLETEAAKCSNR